MPPSRPPSPSLRTVAAGVTALTVALAGCTGAGPAPDAAPAVATGSVLDLTHVHGAALDPGDGTLLLATHHGLLELGDGGPVAVGPVIDLMGFAVVGPDHYLASGHPGPQVDLPQPVGLIESTDGGRTWTPVSRQGRSDFHALTVSDAGVLGYDGSLVRSGDGRAWEQLPIGAEPHTLAAAPDGTSVLATTQEGLQRSTDGGASWTAVEGAPLLQVVTWAGGAAVGVDPAGTVWTSEDGASTWRRGAALGSPPQAVAATAGPDGLRVVVVTADGVVESGDGGRTTTAVPLG
ncbi:F510_1955 family glycosylhydrolase [Geodermatophilus sp. DSM 44513]|uniref:F510_1955 family glycosylhydrolase n=1 Tax=Geodermatophilus sp. DSM 44513 TaxID=1528104 RepID=UPI001289BC87|nr:exo-alpha-sialidase [Geodermatophilus sp. DSM 44513]WNV74807.1 exo-alpha-sialidase [Geodermatophilus sp. DSM 44513]